MIGLLLAAVLVPAVLVPAEAAPASVACEVGQPSPLVLQPGLTATLVACEPAIVDPVAIRFDQRGRLWVVEMRDYPLGPGPDGPAGRIRVLTDSDRDGMFETARTFAEGLLMPTGVQPYRDGCLATVSGAVVHLRDTDGDGTADTTETWISGLDEGNEQLRTNHPTIGPDGWLHLANGLRTVAVTDERVDGAMPVTVRGRDFRVRLDPAGDAPTIEPVTGHGQHGLTFDRWGRRLVCSNARPLDYGVVPQHAAAAAAHVRTLATVDEVVPGGQGRPVHPLVKQFTTSILHAGSFTAACGVHAHWSPLGDASDGQSVFICEPTGSLVHRETLWPRGASFEARPHPADAAWLASTDPWFRPVDLIGGPDGTLYVCDFHRKTIEHPEWVNEELKARMEFTAGRDRGRIYRIAGGAGRSWRPFDGQTGLADRLLSASTGWEASTAARLLLERGVDLAAIDPTGAPADGLLRLRQLQAGQGIPFDRDADLIAAVDDGSADLIAGLLALDAAPLADATLHRIAETRGDDPAIRFALLGCVDGTAARRLLLAHPDDLSDRWMRQAVLMRQTPDTLSAWSDLAPAIAAAGDSGGGHELVRRLAETLGRLHPDLDPPPAAVTLDSPAEVAARLGWGDAGRAVRPPPASLIDEARDPARPLAVRKLGVELLLATAASIDPLRPLLEDPALRPDVLAGLVERREWPLPESLLKSLPRLPAADRETLLTAATATPARSQTLLDAVDRGDVAARLIDSTRSERLRQSTDPALATRAAELLPQPVAVPPEVWTAYVDALEPSRDSADRRQQGRAVFAQHCATCHRLDNTGGAVGPDLSDLRTKSREQVLEAILKPNAAIDAAYIATVALRDDGRVVQGIVVAETDAAVTLRGSDGRDVSLLRSELDAITPTGRSLMPERFDRTIDAASMGDLVHYLKTWRFEIAGRR